MAIDTKEIAHLIDTAMAAKEHLAVWEKTIDEKLTITEQLFDKQQAQIQEIISQFNKTLQSATQHEWQQAASAVHTESKQQTLLLHEVCTEFRKTTKEIQLRVERTSQRISKNLTASVRGLQTGELQQLVEDSAADVKTVASAAISQLALIVKWFHWKNLGLVFLLSLVVALLVSFYIDDEWPWQAHKIATKQHH